MNIYFFLLAFLLLSSAGFCQRLDSTQTVQQQKEALLAKSRLQKAIGWVMFGTGLPVVVGCTYLLTKYDSNDISVNEVRNVLVLSLVYTAASIPLIVAGKNNKAKALSLHLTGRRTAAPGTVSAFHFVVQPALSLKVRF